MMIYSEVPPDIQDVLISTWDNQAMQIITKASAIPSAVPAWELNIVLAKQTSNKCAYAQM
jgi:hypothetical protein